MPLLELSFVREHDGACHLQGLRRNPGEGYRMLMLILSFLRSRARSKMTRVADERVAKANQ